MSLKDRVINPRPLSANDNDFVCPHYDPIIGSKRCRQYLDGGSCARSNEFMCIEWMKANGHDISKLQEESPKQTNQADKPLCDLFGNPVPEEPEESKCLVSKIQQTPMEIKSALPSISNENKLPDVFCLTKEEIASFKSMPVNASIRCKEIGEIWLVPEYTGQDRNEMRFDHAVTFAAVCAAFPEAKISTFERSDTKNTDANEELNPRHSPENLSH